MNQQGEGDKGELNRVLDAVAGVADTCEITSKLTGMCPTQTTELAAAIGERLRKIIEEFKEKG